MYVRVCVLLVSVFELGVWGGGCEFMIDLSEENKCWSVGWCMGEVEGEEEGERQRVVGTQ